MKKHILSVLGLFVAVAINAAPITSSQAAKNVRAFLSLPSNLKSAASPLSLATSDTGIKPYYVFNIGNEGGFIIASGDDAAYSILGYSKKGHFDAENIPENMKAWLNGYAEELSYIQSLNITTRKETASAKTAVKRANIPTLMKSEWDQLYPYNKYCPKYSGDRTNRPTGCVATAMAQVMYYHKWPQSATTAIDEYTFFDESANRDRSEKGLPSTTFKWEDMTDKYNGYSSSKASSEAVATLMQYCGHSVEMLYWPEESAAISENIPYALVRNFGYKETARMVYRDRFASQEEWDDVIYNELAEQRPVIYGGNTVEQGGHQFVCDGYEDGYFHINWGWSGDSDGFFKLSVLNPTDQGTGGADSGMNFSEMQSAVIGVMRPVADDKISVEDIAVKAEKEIEVSVNFTNINKTNTSVQFDLKLPEGMEVLEDKAELVAGRSEKGDHKLSVNKVSDGSYRFVVYSPSNSVFVGDGALVKFILSIPSEMNNGEFKAEIKNASVCDTKLVSQKIGESSFNITFTMGIDNVTNNAGTAEIYTIDGIRIKTSVKNLDKGVYIINGKKVVLK